MGFEEIRNLDGFFLIGFGEIFKVFLVWFGDFSILRNILKMKWCV